MSKQAFDVLGDHVHFEVYVIARFELRKICDFPGLWNNGHFEVFARQTRNRQTDTFDCNRTFEHQIPAQLFRIRDPDRPRLAVVLDAGE